MSIFGASYQGPLPALTEKERISAGLLSEHVTVLASEIGARSLTSAPENLEIAAAYIEHQFKKSNCAVSMQSFTVNLLKNKNAQFKNDTVIFPSTNFETRNIIAEIKGSAKADESNLKSRALLARSLKDFKSGVQFPAHGIALPEFISGVRFSDQDSFWKFGYPALMVTDTANYRYPFYHEDEDTPDKLDFKMLARVVTGLINVVEQLCKK